MKSRIVSGITATGSLTLGNYIGAIKNMIKMQNDYDSFIFVADLHALTIKIDPKELVENRKSIMALYLALGIDPNITTLFYQSDILEHTFLNWITLTETTMGELSRMTQFKDKSAKIKNSNGTELIPSGLFAYPALMAADILLYNPKFVPVGIDQKQHIELTRNLAQRLNNKYKTNFNIPEIVITKTGSKIMSLTDPLTKMSKSSDSKNGTIFLLEDPESAYKKIQKAVTDSENKVYLSDEKPGIKNLLTIYASLNEITIEQAAEKFINANYKEFKEAVGNTVKEFLTTLQIKYQDQLSKVDTTAKIGAEKARIFAQNTVKHIREKIGL